MSKYPIRSTARVFYNVEGEPCTLPQLIKAEPLWAQNRIYTLEEQNEQLREAAQAFIDDLKSRYPIIERVGFSCKYVAALNELLNVKEVTK